MIYQFYFIIYDYFQLCFVPRLFSVPLLPPVCFKAAMGNSRSQGPGGFRCVFDPTQLI